MPDIEEEALPYWQAYLALSRRRPVGFDVGAIPLPEIESFFRLYGIEDPEDQRVYLAILERVDQEHLELLKEKEK